MEKLKRFFDPRFFGKASPGKNKKALLFFNPSQEKRFLFWLGTFTLFWGVGMAAFFWIPLVKSYFRFFFSPPQNENSFSPPQNQQETSPYQDFYLFIPKIKASAKIIPNVPADNKKVYLKSLKKGVAHAAGSGFPGENRPIYLFAHSVNNPANIVRYNAVFFLLHKLEKGNLIIVFFNGKKFKYRVKEKKILGSQETAFLSSLPRQELLILQTCWPPGTLWKRLLVIAEKTE